MRVVGGILGPYKLHLVCFGSQTGWPWVRVPWSKERVPHNKGEWYFKQGSRVSPSPGQIWGSPRRLCAEFPCSWPPPSRTASSASRGGREALVSGSTAADLSLCSCRRGPYGAQESSRPRPLPEPSGKARLPAFSRLFLGKWNMLENWLLDCKFY